MAFMVLVGAATKNAQLDSYERSERQIETQAAADQRDSQPAIKAPVETGQRSGDFGYHESEGDAAGQTGEQSQNQLVWLGDTLAQWAMAIFSLMALVVSVWAVLVVRGTLKAALAANRGFKQSAERQLRAYVGFYGVDHEQLADGSVHLRPRWKNAGQTPTRFMRANGGHAFLEGRIDDDFGYPDQNGKSGSFSLGPGHEERINGPVIEPADLARIRTTKARLYLWGWVEYSDVFDGTPRRRTEFCIQWVVQANGNTASIVAGWHNGTDDECLFKPKTSGQQ